MGFRDTLRTIRKKISKKAVIVTAILALGITGATATVQTVKADRPDCNNNAVMYCGAFNVSTLRNQYNTNASTRAIYAASPFGITSSEFNSLTNNYQMGAVHKNGNVTVGGRVVATGSVTAGRWYMPGSTKMPGVNAYSRAPSVSFKQESLQAYVKLDANGQFEFAIIQACGNPVVGHPTAPPAKPSFTIEKKVRVAGSNSEFKEDITVSPGQRVEYVIGVANTGNVTLHNMVVRDKLPNSMTYVKKSTRVKSSYASSHALPDGITGRGVGIGDIPSKGTAFVTFEADAPEASNTNLKVCDTGKSLLHNVAYAKPNELPEKNNGADVETCRPTKPSFTIEKKVRVAGTSDTFTENVKADPGTLLEFVIGVQNTGNTPLKNVLVKDVLPAGMVFKSGSATLTNSVGVKDKKVSDDLVTSKGVTLASMKVGEVDFIFFKANLPAASNPVVKECETGTTKLTNHANAKPEGLTTKEDTASAETCKKTPNFTIVKDVRKKGDTTWKQDVTVNYGDSVEYRITVKNTGATDLTNVLVKDARPVGVEYTAGSLKLNGVANTGDLFGAGITVAKIAQGAQAEVTFEAKVTGRPTPCVTKTFHNIASALPTGLTVKEDDANVTANCVVAHPGVKIEKTVDRTEVAVNGKFVYTLVVTNTGDTKLTNVKVTDPAPEGVNFLSSDKPAGTTVTLTAKSFAATIAQMAKGEKVTFNIQSQVVKQVVGDITNTACVDAPEVPGNPDDCSTVKIHNPIYECTELSALSLGEFDFRFTPQIVKTGSITLKNVSYDFGDGSQVVVKNDATSIDHSFPATDKDATYDVTATVAFNVDGAVKSVDCAVEVQFTVTPDEPCPYNHDLPKDDKNCVPPCPYNPQIPNNSPECKPPTDVCPSMPGNQTNPDDCKEKPPVTVIPSTGSGSVAGGAVGISAATYGAFALLNKRRATKNLK